MTRQAKIIDGVEHWPCVHCPNWKPADEFPYAGPKSRMKPPIKSRCKECDRKYQRERYARNREKAKELARGYQRTRRARDKSLKQWADREYRDHLLERSAYKLVEVDLMRPWLEEAVERFGRQRVIAALKVSGKQMVAYEGSTVEFMRVTTADRLAVLLERQFEFSDLLEQEPGVDGWAKSGARCCEGCGTCWHAHYAKNMCMSCYKRQYHGRRTLNRDAAWSRFHVRCRSCERTDRKHRSRGLCMVCYQRHRTAKTLDLFPVSIETFTYKKARAREGDSVARAS